MGLPDTSPHIRPPKTQPWPGCINHQIALLAQSWLEAGTKLSIAVKWKPDIKNSAYTQCCNPDNNKYTFRWRWTEGFVPFTWFSAQLMMRLLLRVEEHRALMGRNQKYFLTIFQLNYCWRLFKEDHWITHSLKDQCTHTHIQPLVSKTK